MGRKRNSNPDLVPHIKEKGEMLRVQLSLGIATLLATRSLTQAQTPIERGSYLVNGLLTCGNCHTPRGPGGAFAMDRQLSGGPQEWDRLTYKVRGANITPDKETGIGNWSDADMKRAITTGRGRTARRSRRSCPMVSTRSSPRVISMP